MNHKYCDLCGIPWDAGYFDESSVQPPPPPGQELVLARYTIHRNYCGVLMGFAQFSDRFAQDNSQVQTKGYIWQVRCNGQPRDPYISLDHILNPWGQVDMPVHLRLEESCRVELVIHNVDVAAGDLRELKLVAGRITGRYWYSDTYGGRPNPL